MRQSLEDFQVDELMAVHCDFQLVVSASHHLSSVAVHLVLLEPAAELLLDLRRHLIIQMPQNHGGLPPDDIQGLQGDRPCSLRRHV